MKIGLLSSHRGQKQFEKEHEAIVEYFERKGHEVIHSLHTTLEQLLPLNYIEREAIFMQFFQELETCDIVFAECTTQSTQVGFGLSYLRSKGKPIVLMTLRDAMQDMGPKGDLYSNVENLLVTEYSLGTLSQDLNEALSYMESRIDKRFTIIFPSHLLAKIEEQAKKKKMPKSVYIRQLIEEDLRS